MLSFPFLICLLTKRKQLCTDAFNKCKWAIWHLKILCMSWKICSRNAQHISISFSHTHCMKCAQAANSKDKTWVGGTLWSHPKAGRGIDCLLCKGLQISVFSLPQSNWVCSAVARLWGNCMNASCISSFRVLRAPKWHLSRRCKGAKRHRCKDTHTHTNAHTQHKILSTNIDNFGERIHM